MSTWRPSRLTPAQLEERRLAAARMLSLGTLSQAEIARQLGVSDSAVSRWKRRLATEGEGALRRRAHTGRPPRLAEGDWTRLGALLGTGSLAAGFETEQWTLHRVACLIEHEFGVHYHVRSLGRALHAHGLDPLHRSPRFARGEAHARVHGASAREPHSRTRARLRSDVPLS